ncbi:MAG: outer membrane protein transport protein [Myxococcaceae bacterium]
MKTALLSVLVSSVAFAGGFAVSEQDAAISGRAGAGVGSSDDAAAIHFNPAGLALVKDASVVAGATAIIPSVSAKNPSSGQATSNVTAVKVPPHVYGAYGFGNWALGVGFNAPFGGGLQWPVQWPGRFALTQMDLQVLATHLGAGLRINDQWSVGLAVTLYRVDVYLNKAVDFVDSEGSAQLGGGGWAFGGGLGVNWAPRADLSFGLTGRIPASAALSGRVHFEQVPGAFQSTLPDQTISSQMTLPGSVALGGKGDLGKVRLYGEIAYTFWSSFDSFKVQFANATTPGVNEPRHWQNAPTFRLGAEKDFGVTTVRAGALLDLAASPADTLDPSLPDSTRIGFSLGAGRPVGPVKVDLAYQFVAFLPRTSSGDAFPAQYNASAHLIALSLRWAQTTAAP